MMQSGLLISRAFDFKLWYRKGKTCWCFLKKNLGVQWPMWSRGHRWHYTTTSMFNSGLLLQTSSRCSQSSLCPFCSATKYCCMPLSYKKREKRKEKKTVTCLFPLKSLSTALCPWWLTSPISWRKPLCAENCNSFTCTACVIFFGGRGSGGWWG